VILLGELRPQKKAEVSLFGVLQDEERFQSLSRGQLKALGPLSFGFLGNELERGRPEARRPVKSHHSDPGERWKWLGRG